MSEIIIGIDLGTTNSMSAFVYPEGARIVKQGETSTFTPSVVSYKNDRIYTGYDALKIAHEQPEQTFFSFKRFLGKSLTDIERELHFFPFKVSADENGSVVFPLDKKHITPEELSAEILKRIKTDTEKYLNQPVKKAVITIPAYFDDTQRQAVKNSALLAGLDPVRIINEPTAAAIAYGLDQKSKGKILVYDLGGGTFDVSVLDLKGKIFRVLSTNGNTYLGGDDFDNLIVGHIRDAFKQKHSVDFSDSPQARQYLKITAEKIKIELSASDEFSVNVTEPDSGNSIKYVLTAKMLEELLKEKTEHTLGFVKKAIKDAGLSKEEIDEVVLVGGSTRIPFIRKTLASYFNKPIHVRINPDEVVAIGASILGHLLSGKRRDFVLMDIIPLSLGIETIGGSFSKLIMKNSPIPAKVTEIYSTSVDNQTAISINIYQGEREMVKDCRLLGKMKLSNIPPMPAGFPKLEVMFTVDNNGILSVTALEQRSGKETHIEIIPEHGLNPLKVKQMIEESIDNAEVDFTMRNLADFKVKAEMMIAGYHKIRSDIKTILPEADFNDVEDSFKNLQNALKENNPYALKTAMDLCGKLTVEVSDEIMSRKISQSLKETL